MLASQSKKIAVLVLVVGILSLVLGGVFIAQGFSKANLITDAMVLEKASYSAEDAKGMIAGIIDTPKEAQVMAGILREHRIHNSGHYTELERTDPSSDSILKAMTLENSLNLAQLGYGLTDVVKANGAFMIIIGLSLTVGSASVIRSGRGTS